MPSVSVSQRRLMALAEHHPAEVYKKNKSILHMKNVALHDYASTPESGLPYKKKKKRRS